MIWRPGFLNDVAEREIRRASEEERREISREAARQKALLQQRLKPIPGHEKYPNWSLNSYWWTCMSIHY